MGAISFVDYAEAENAREAYKKLCEEAESYYGHQEGYNGTISTCSLGRCVMQFDKYTKTNEKKALKYIDDKDGGVKWTAHYIDLGVVRYEAITVKKVAKECKAKYKMKYVVSPKYSEGKKLSYDTVQEANKSAMQLALKYGTPMCISKEYVNIGGSSDLGEVIIEVKEYKTKPKLKPMDNRKIREIHKYVFFGYASY